jgi:hypothetical protein
MRKPRNRPKEVWVTAPAFVVLPDGRFFRNTDVPKEVWDQLDKQTKEAEKRKKPKQ